MELGEIGGWSETAAASGTYTYALDKSESCHRPTRSSPELSMNSASPKPRVSRPDRPQRNMGMTNEPESNGE
jgi:hypothetical protein